MSEKNKKETKGKDFKLEEALGKLSEIVKKLEDEDIDLENALKIFEEGVTLTKHCHHTLDEAEKKIEILTGSSASGVSLKNYDER